MFKRKPEICRPCREHVHAGCDGPKACACPTCEQLRELGQVARESAALVWPFEPPEDVPQNA